MFRFKPGGYINMKRILTTITLSILLVLNSVPLTVHAQAPAATKGANALIWIEQILDIFIVPAILFITLFFVIKYSIISAVKTMKDKKIL